MHPAIILIAHDIRSCHNIGSLLRTAEGLAVEHVYLTGYSPYPVSNNDARLPHLAARATTQISKTALGAEQTVSWSHTADVLDVITSLKHRGFTVMALEQSSHAQQLPAFEPPLKLALLLGREVEGISQDLLRACDGALEIPMYGKKESFNVVQAAAMALYHARFMKSSSQANVVT